MSVVMKVTSRSLPADIRLIKHLCNAFWNRICYEQFPGASQIEGLIQAISTNSIINISHLPNPHGLPEFSSGIPCLKVSQHAADFPTASFFCPDYRRPASITVREENVAPPNSRSRSVLQKISNGILRTQNRLSCAPSLYGHGGGLACCAWTGERRNYGSSSLRAYGIDAGQPTPWSHPKLLAAGEITPGISAREFSGRRDALMDWLPAGSILVVGAASLKYMSGIIPYPYRQDADYLYLTGCQQPGGIAVLEKRDAQAGAKLTMFMPEAARDVEIWNGHLADEDAALSFFGADAAYPVHAMEKELGAILTRADHIYYDKRSSSDLHSRVGGLARAVLESRVRCPRTFLHHLRWRKSAAEVRLMRKSCQIASEAMLSSMKASATTPHESHLTAVMEYECRRNGAQRMAFPSVVAGGANACTIHYSRNDREVREGDLLLLDAGCEYYGYASDITRVWPPHGKFSKAQREVYEEVLGVLKECISMCRPGVTLRHIHQQSVNLLSKSIMRLGLTAHDLTQVTSFKYREFYPTSVGHWLGMDTHDSASVSLSEPLKPGVILTLEPGLYIQSSQGSSQRYAGIGVRIEDDILITEHGHEVLTASTPKEVEEIEEVINAAAGSVSWTV